MHRRIDDDDTLRLKDDFAVKADELDFDPWGGEEDDGSPRRRDPLRRPAGHRPPAEDDVD